MRFQDLLTRSVRGLWITTYSFELRLYDQYVLRTVSQGKLNAVVLADQEKLAAAWRNLPAGEEYLTRRTGRRYLLRGVRAAAGGAFHPKTYLFSRDGGATLVVGSGNLTRDGIDHGQEVFAYFDSEREADLPSMRAWAEWMGRLVEREEDELLHRRWLALREESPWMHGSSAGSSFVANDEESIVERLTAQLGDRVAELHATAPFFDRDAQALQELIRRLDPARLELYIGAGVNVNGSSLAAVLGTAREARVRRFEPGVFVHAKLLGAIEDGGRGLLLAGSPNLSTAALLGVCTEAGANWEAAVIREGSGDQVRSVFESNPRLTLVEATLESLKSLEFSEDERPESERATLRSAVWGEDGRIATRATGATLPSGAMLAWAGGSHAAALDEEGVTVESLAEHDPLPLLVWLVDSDAAVLTNAVPVDDPVALEESLLGSRQKHDSRPSELRGIEDAPLIRIALWASDKFIFDPDREPVFQRTQETIETPDAEEASDFWERYTREELRYDPRSRSYRPLAAGRDLGPVDELLRELRRMLDAAPGEPRPLLRILNPAAEIESAAESGGETAGGSWSMEARQRRRAYNLFLRWCRAVGDPRHMLISPDAPVVNYETLLGVIFAAWAHGALEPKMLRKLLLTLLSAFVGVDKRQPGFLGRVDDPQRAEALARLDPLAIELGAGLAAVAMESSWRGSIYEWQPVLRRGLELDVLLPGEWSVRVVRHLLGKEVDVDWIYTLLRDRLDFVDEQTWCERAAADLGFEAVSLDLHRTATVRSWVFVRGAGDPLADTRLLSLVDRFFEFKDVPAVAVSPDGEDVLVFELGEPPRARLGGVSHRSPAPATLAQLREIERQGGSWADLLELELAA